MHDSFGQGQGDITIVMGDRMASLAAIYLLKCYFGVSVESREEKHKFTKYQS